MWVVDLYKKSRRQKEGLEKYYEAANRIVSDGVITDDELPTLTALAEEYNLSLEKRKPIHAAVMARVYQHSISDKRLSKEEVSVLTKLMQYFGLEEKDVSFTVDEARKYHSLDKIAEGELPDISEIAEKAGVRLLDREVLHRVEAAELTKLKKITKNLNYRGTTGSIRIMKGVHYRMGSVKVERVQTEVLTTEDIGLFWLTSKRIGFKGQRKHFAIEYKKIASFEVGSLGLMIFKDGKEAPYMVKMSDYDLPCGIASFYLNAV